MTKQEAKEVSLEVWRYLAEHPEIHSKADLPQELFEKIEPLKYECSLCELFKSDCRGCPLCEADEACTEYYSAFCRWDSNSAGDMTRKEAALRIVEIVSAWEPEE
jgi:hypothetical protein